MFGDKEYATVALRHRSGPEFARLEQDPRIDVIEIRGLDHSMFDLKARSEVFDAVAPYLREVLRPSAPRFRPVT